MQIPSKKECYQLICEMEMLDHIADHSIQVCRVALFLAEQMKAMNIYLNYDLIQASALLHDITKTRSFKTGEHHALTGAQLLTSLGYPEVGDVIGQHVWVNDYPDSDPPNPAEIVNYADKRVLHDKVASLHDRMSYILEKYGKTPDRDKYLMEMWKRTELLENKIFRWLSFSPDKLGDLLGEEDYTSEFLNYRKKIQNSESYAFEISASEK